MYVLFGLWVVLSFGGDAPGAMLTLSNIGVMLIGSYDMYTCIKKRSKMAKKLGGKLGGALRKRASGASSAKVHPLNA